MTEPVQEYVSLRSISIFQPIQTWLPEFLGNIDAPDAVPLGIYVDIPGQNILDAHFDQFADAHAGGRHEADRKIVHILAVAEQAVFQVLIVCLADYIFQERLLLMPDHKDFGGGFLTEFHIGIHGPYSKIDGLRFVVIDEITFVKHQVCVVCLRIQRVKLFYCTEICANRILRHIFELQMGPEIRKWIFVSQFMSPFIRGDGANAEDFGH